MPLSSNKIATRFNRAATTYDDVASLQRSMADDLLQRFLQSQTQPFPLDAATDTAIADLGCGTGYLLHVLSRHGLSNLSGFDLARDMLQVTSTRLGPNAAELIEADLQSLPVADDYFDVVFSNAAIQWCDADAAAKEIKRVLRPAGHAFVSTFGPQTLRQWKEAFATHGHERVHTFKTASQIADLFEKNGLSVQSCEPQLHTRQFETVRDMFDSVRKLGASNAQANYQPMSKSTYRAIQNHFRDLLTANGHLELTFEVIVIHAVV